MFLVRYIGQLAGVYVPSAGQAAAKGGTIETTEAIAASLLLDPTSWEAANEATLGVVPKLPTPPVMISGIAGPFDPEASYSGGVIVTEGGMNYVSKVASHGETPSLAPHAWELLGPVTSGGVPGILMPMMSLGNPRGREIAFSFGTHGYFARAIVPKTGKLKDLSVFNQSAHKGQLRAAVYDTGQASASVFTRLAQSAAVEQGQAGKYQSFGALGEPALVAGQHIMLAIATEGSVIELAPTYPGPVEGLPASYLPIGVSQMLNGQGNLSSLAWPATVKEGVEADMIAVSEIAPHVIARIE